MDEKIRFAPGFAEVTAKPSNLVENIINSSIDGILAFDKSCRYTIWNPGMERISGIPRHQVIGRAAREVFPFLEETGEIRNFISCLEGETIRVSDRPYTIPQNGRQGYFEAVYSPIFDERGRIVGGLGVIKDITETRDSWRQLLESEVKYRSLTKHAQDAIFSADSAGKILSWNVGASQIFEFSEDEVLGQSLSRFLPEDLWRKFLIEYANSSDRAKLARRGQATELLGFRKHGASFPMDVSLSAWKKGGDIFISAIIRDVSERVRLLNQIEEKTDFYEALMKAQSDLGEGVVVIDLVSKKVQFSNKAMTEILGYSSEELENMPDIFSAIIASDQQEFLKKRVIFRKEQGLSPDHYDTILIKKNDERIYVSISVKTLETSDGLSAVALIRDVTEKKRKELALVQSEKRNRTLMELTQDLVVITDLDGTIRYLSPCFKSIMGYEPKDWIGKSLASLCHPEDHHIATENIEKIADGKVPPAFTGRGIHKNGHIIFLEVVSSPIIELGRVTGVLSICRDISTSVQAHDEILNEKQKYESLLMATSEGVAITENGVIVEASPRFAEIFGYRLDEIIGKTPMELVIETEKLKTQQNILERNSGPFQTIGLKKDGVQVKLEVRARNFVYKGRDVRLTSIRELT